MVKRLVALLLAIVLIGSLAPVARAQEGSPEATPPHDFSLLKGLGLPEINLVATDSDITGLPDSVPAGLYLVTMDNQTASQEIEAYFSILPASVTTDQAIKDISSAEEEVPAWVYEATWAGGPNAYGGQLDAVVIELTAGSWWVAYDRLADGDVQPTDTAASLTVTEGTAGTPAAGASNTITVNMKEYAFEVPATLAAGPQVWELTNSGDQPHFLVLWGVPDGTTSNQVLGTIQSFMTGTPAADAVGFQDLQDIYDTSFISNGQHQWIELDLAPGTYAAVCFFPDAESQAPHAVMGMVQVFTVS